MRRSKLWTNSGTESALRAVCLAMAEITVIWFLERWAELAHEEARPRFPACWRALAGLLDGRRNGGDLRDGIVAGGDGLAGAQPPGFGLEAAHRAADLQRHPIDDEDDEMAASNEPPTASDQTASIRGFEMTDDGAQGDEGPVGQEGLAHGGAIGFAPSTRRLMRPGVVARAATSARRKCSPLSPAPCEAPR